MSSTADEIIVAVTLMTSGMTTPPPRFTKVWQRHTDSLPGLLDKAIDGSPEIHGQMQYVYKTFLLALVAESELVPATLRQATRAAYWKRLFGAAKTLQNSGLGAVYGADNLPAWLHAHVRDMFDLPMPPGLLDQLRIERLSADSPWRIQSDGSVVLDPGVVADMRQCQELRNYLQSFQPAGKRGRPQGQPKPPRSGRRALDAAKAALAARMRSDGAGWQQIAEAAGVEYDPYDRKAVNRARAAVGRLIERGHLNTKSKKNAR